MDMKALGRKLKSARNAAGLSMKEAAEKLNMTYQNIDHYEAGRRKIPLPNLETLAEYYGLHLVLDLVEPGQVPMFVAPDVVDVVKAVDELPEQQRALLLRLLKLALRTPIGARAAVAMMESMTGEEGPQQSSEEPRQAI